MSGLGLRHRSRLRRLLRVPRLWLTYYGLARAIVGPADAACWAAGLAWRVMRD
jgi:hypothetical protein